MSRVLVVDGLMPDREASAGERATIDLTDGLRALGHDVALTCWWPSELTEQRGRTLRETGLPVMPAAGAAHVRDVTPQTWDVVIVHRPGPALLASEVLRDGPAATVYFGHDIHRWRLAAQERSGLPVNRREMLVSDVAERRCWQAYDLTVYPTVREAEHVNAVAGARALAMPYYRLCDVDLPSSGGPGARRGLLMVGSSRHAPNRDAVEIALTRVLPLVDENVTIVGDWPEQARAAFSRPGVRFVGQVSEKRLRALHASHLALLAPLRFGAGSRRKLVAAMGFGLPVIATTEGCRGLLVRDAGPRDGVVVADDPPGMARAVRRLRDDPRSWMRLVNGAREAVARVYGAPTYDEAVADLLQRALRIRSRRP